MVFTYRRIYKNIKRNNKVDKCPLHHTDTVGRFAPSFALQAHHITAIKRLRPAGSVQIPQLRFGTSLNRDVMRTSLRSVRITQQLSEGRRFATSHNNRLAASPKLPKGNFAKLLRCTKYLILFFNP